MKYFLALFMFCNLGLAGYAATSPPSKKSDLYNLIYKNDGGVIGLYRSLDPTILQSSDESQVSGYLLPFNQIIINYILERYGENLADYFPVNDPMIFFSGTLVAGYEQVQGTYNPQSKMAPEKIVNCLVDAIGVAKGVKELIASYEALLNGGAALDTIFKLVKNVIRRYAAWFMVGYLVYDFGGCAGWW